MSNSSSCRRRPFAPMTALRSGSRRSAAIARASPSTSPGSTRSPWTSGVTRSGTPPTRVATTGYTSRHVLHHGQGAALPIGGRNGQVERTPGCWARQSDRRASARSSKGHGWRTSDRILASSDPPPTMSTRMSGNACTKMSAHSMRWCNAFWGRRFPTHPITGAVDEMPSCARTSIPRSGDFGSDAVRDDANAIWIDALNLDHLSPIVSRETATTTSAARAMTLRSRRQRKDCPSNDHVCS